MQQSLKPIPTPPVSDLMAFVNLHSKTGLLTIKQQIKLKKRIGKLLGGVQ